MNVLKPELTWIDGRCYRLLGNGEWSNNRQISPYVEDNDEIIYDSEEECCDVEIEIVPHGLTTFKHAFHVAKSFYPHIVGAKHAVRKRIEAETGALLQIPKPGQEGEIVIISSNRKAIIKARRRIDLIMAAARKKLRPTHFLSIPLNEGQIIMKFNAFKSEVLTNLAKTSRGVDDKIFQTQSKLHLTIGVMTLLDDTERNQAIEALNYCKEHIIKPAIEKHGQIPIYMKGTEIMNDDPSEARVLYTEIVDKAGALQEIADGIVNYYTSVGLMYKRKEQVKLHVTLINTKFKANGEETKQTFERFDATEILKVHKNTFFGETTLKQIHISQRHTIGATGYYQATAKINLLTDL